MWLGYSVGWSICGFLKIHKNFSVEDRLCWLCKTDRVTILVALFLAFKSREYSLARVKVVSAKFGVQLVSTKIGVTLKRGMAEYTPKH